MDRSGLCLSCVHGREEGDRVSISIRNGREFLVLLDATIAWANEVRTAIETVVAETETAREQGREDTIQCWLSLISNLAEQVDTGPLVGGHRVLGTILRTKDGTFLIPPQNPAKTYCRVPSLSTQRTLQEVGS